MTLILDAGALIAIERADRKVWAKLRAALAAGEPPVTHGAVVGQVWRGSARRARLALVLRGARVVAVDEGLGRAAGVLLARSDTSDVVDAALVALARDGDIVLTSDADDIAVLARAAGVHVDVVPV